MPGKQHKLTSIKQEEPGTGTTNRFVSAFTRLPFLKLLQVMKGELITSVETVCRLADQGKAIMYLNGRIPAAFMQNYQARFLQNLIDRKLLYHYKKDENVKLSKS